MEPNKATEENENTQMNTDLNLNQNINDETPDAEEVQRDTIFGEEDVDKAALAEINFDLVDAGRWLLKVIAGPNNGAEFSMHSNSSYVIGTDPSSCDIVFHDNSVSRQHARISIASDDGMSIEDLKSRNQTVVDGDPIKAKKKLMPNAVITIGTTSFTVYDREGEMQTIISPLLPAIVKVLQKEEPPPPPPKKVEPEIPEESAKPVAPPAQLLLEDKSKDSAMHTLGAFIVLGIIAGLFGIIGLGTVALFKSEPVVMEQTTNAPEIISDALKPFPYVTPYYNPTTGTLQLMGHVLTQADKTRLMYSLQGLTFIKGGVDDSDVIVDEYVWQETNLMLSKNPTWKSISVQAFTPGKFVLTGYLQTRNQSDQLSEYIANNFTYPDLLEKRITVEEDVVSKINNIMLNSGFRNVITKMDNGALTLTGGIPPDKEEQFSEILDELSKIPGVRDVKNLTVKIAIDQSMINITDKYLVTGVTRRGQSYSVVINGRILSKGDELDGMQLKEIKPNAIFLEKDGVQYRIDYSR
ncbi:MAG: type III secretion system inner membrane ring subunit SctD [Parachlamydiaceae bacterium]|nr:type III secretion system inner membrane ring subunit SctD [Parachlamydiaceae bacterium]